MADKLIIVESPAKANTIKKFLGGNTKVVASMGHIRDLPKSKLGVNVDNDFEPEYINIRGKGDLIKSLKKDAKNAKKIYLATDPDREGEAIAWHLAYILNEDKAKIQRVTFNEITKTAVQKAIKEPREIDLNTVDAQQARRVLDRIVGYKMSPVLWKKVKRGLSAGRVQSVAVKLIVDREEEIEKFIPEEYWNIFVNLLESKSKKVFEAKFYGKNGKKQEIHSKEQVDEILKAIEQAKYIVDEVKKGEKGLLYVSGPSVMLGYHNNPEETQKVISIDENGKKWINIGDIVQQLDNGEYKYIGRQKRNFVSGIENIYPEEIENLLLKLPEVREVVVTPIPDEMVQFIPRYHISLYDKNIDYKDFENRLVSLVTSQLSENWLPGSIEYYDKPLERMANSKINISFYRTLDEEYLKEGKINNQNAKALRLKKI